MSLDDALALIDRTRQVIESGDEQGKALMYAAARAGAKLEELVGGYPSPSGRPLTQFYDRSDANGRAYKSKFKSLRQQRKVFALRHQGKIPYRRSGKLGASLTSKGELIGGGVQISIGTNLEYANRVIGKVDQSHYHMGTWTPLEDNVQAHSGEAIAEFSLSLNGYLTGYIKGGGK